MHWFEHSYESKFLNELVVSWKGDSDTDKKIRALCSEASDRYEKTAKQFNLLCKMFPFPIGGEPNQPSQAEQAIQLLLTAKQHEVEGVALLEEIYSLLD